MSTNIYFPDFSERHAYRSTIHFGSWYDTWNQRTKGRKALNSREFLGNITLLLHTHYPQTREEWEAAYRSFIGDARLVEHAERFSKRTGGKLPVQEALTHILIHTIDETWWGWTAQLAAVDHLNRSWARETVGEQVEALVAALEDAEDRTLTATEREVWVDAEIRALLTRHRPYRLATAWENQRWDVSVVYSPGGVAKAGFWVRADTYLSWGHSIPTKEWELKKVLNWLAYHQGMREPAPAFYLTYQRSVVNPEPHAWGTYRYHHALGEVMNEKQREFAAACFGEKQEELPAPPELPPVEARGGVRLRMLTEDEMFARIQAIKEAEEAERQEQARKMERVEELPPTLF